MLQQLDDRLYKVQQLLCVDAEMALRQQRDAGEAVDPDWREVNREQHRIEIDSLSQRGRHSVCVDCRWCSDAVYVLYRPLLVLRCSICIV